MKKVVHYRQCRFVKKVGAGEAVQVSWIPNNYAELGLVLRFKNEDGTWDNGWEVREVWGQPRPEHQLMNFHELSKQHLKATGDISV